MGGGILKQSHNIGKQYCPKAHTFSFSSTAKRAETRVGFPFIFSRLRFILLIYLFIYFQANSTCKK